MNCTIYPGSIKGEVRAPASKSFAQRAVFAAALSNGTSVLNNFEFSDDTWHATHNAVNMGSSIRQFGHILEIEGNPAARVREFYAGESGLTARILSALLMVFEGETSLSGSGSLLSRPFDPIFNIYDQLGVSYHSNNACLPIQIANITRSTDLEIDGSLSSQFFTGLLMALPYIEFDHKLIINNPTSGAYIEMTLQLLREFGINWTSDSQNSYQLKDHNQFKPTEYTIEGDWSGAAFLIAAGLTAGSVHIKNIQANSLQADRSIMNLLEDHFVTPQDSLTVKNKKLDAFDFDATNCPDLFPPLATIAVFAKGPSRIRGTHRLSHKESNRAKVLQEEFGKLWVRVDLEGDDMIIHPSKPAGGLVNAHNDHRIAMALAILALNASEPITIKGIECVSKSYPQFFEDLKRLGVKLDMD